MASQLVSRAGWGAAAPVCRVLYTGYEAITVHYPGPTPWTTAKSVGGRGIDRSSPAAFAASCDHRFCPGIVRGYQAFHMGPERGGCDIFYSSLICPHGVRFEGRGPGVKSGAQGTVAGNNRSVGIQYMGGVTPSGVEDPFPDSAKLAYYDEAARFARPLRWGHRDWKSTACPGEIVYAWRRAGFPKPAATTPPPRQGDDGMFAYDKPHGSGRPEDDVLVIVCGGKQTRVIGATVGATVRGAPYYIGRVDAQMAGWIATNYGRIVGLPR